MLIVAVWIMSLGISLAPQLGWKDPDYLTRIGNGTCIVSQDPAYQVSASGELRADPKCQIIFETGELRLRTLDEIVGESVDASRNAAMNFDV